MDSRYLGLSPRASVKSEIRDREPSAGYGSHLRTSRLGVAILASIVVLENEGPERKNCKRVEQDWISASMEGRDPERSFHKKT